MNKPFTVFENNKNSKIVFFFYIHVMFKDWNVPTTNIQ